MFQSKNKNIYPCILQFYYVKVRFKDLKLHGCVSMMPSPIHYENMPMQYKVIFHGCKNDNFQMKIFDIFLILAQNIDCGYTLELPQ